MNTFYLNAPLTLAAADAESLPRQFAGVAYSGALIHDYGTPVVIDLASTTVESPMALLHQHAAGVELGVITQVANNGDTLTVAGELFTDLDPIAALIARKSQRGLGYQMSIGLYAARAETLQVGAVRQVNGREVSGPLTILRDGRVREVSIVTLGADRHTNAQFFAAGSDPAPTDAEVSPMPDPNPDTSELDALKSHVAELTARLTDVTARAEAAEAALNQERTAAKLAAIRDLFRDLNRTFSEKAAAHYLAMSPETFAAVAADLRALKPHAPAHLFREQATGEPNAPIPTLNAHDIYAARRVC